MAHLKSLNFTAVPKNVAANPVHARRATLVARLEEQRSLAQDPNYAPTMQRLVKADDGTKQLVQIPRRVRPWWRTDANGAVVLTVRCGFKAIEFDKGKAGIAVPSKEKLPAIIDTLIAAVRAGELDDVLAQQAKARSTPKAKRAS
jgi:hypothetical protein